MVLLLQAILIFFVSSYGIIKYFWIPSKNH